MAGRQKIAIQNPVFSKGTSKTVGGTKGEIERLSKNCVAEARCGYAMANGRSSHGNPMEEILQLMGTIPFVWVLTILLDPFGAGCLKNPQYEMEWRFI